LAVSHANKVFGQVPQEEEVRVIPLKYANAATLANQLREVIGTKTVADDRTNQVIIRGTQKTLDLTLDVIKQLDIAVPERSDASTKAAAEASEFPYRVEFEQGASRFENGDKITIVQVRGTADTFAPGNIYCIYGRYKLASHDRAQLAAYTTAMNSSDGTGYSFRVQTMPIDRGEGTFALFLPMSCQGWPHVSFYSADAGEGFGGIYFGTGDSVLRKWWDSKEAGQNSSADLERLKLLRERSLLTPQVR
jgi:hypothetical protein